MKPDIRVFPTLEDLIREPAAEFEALARRLARDGRRFCAALSGGSTPKPLYELLGAGNRARTIPWTNVHLFQVDERCVPPNHPESNYRMIRQALLDHVPIPAANLHRMAGENTDLEAAASDYAAQLASVLQPKPGEQPRFDLIFLGLGPDGHTASLFPGSAALDEQDRWVRVNYVEKLRMNRLTLTLPVINAAALIIFLVAGHDKAGILREVLRGTKANYPAQRIRPANGQLKWYLDAAAAELL